MSALDRSANGRHAALVIGAGIAGIQAALDIADAGFKVYLVEKSPSIGGRMSQLDKTFPTLDCSSCILTPKMADVPRNPNITLLTCTQVKEVRGKAGDFHVTLERAPRYRWLKKFARAVVYAPTLVPSSRPTRSMRDSTLTKQSIAFFRKPFLPGLLINLGMWIERFIIVPVSLEINRFPFMWGQFKPGIEVPIFIGTLAFFILLYMAASRLVPLVPVWEVQEGQLAHSVRKFGKETVVTVSDLE